MDGISKTAPEKMPQPNKERVNKMANNQSTDRQICYLETGSTDPGYNLAFEEYILLNKKEGHYLLLWQNDKTVVVGQYQNTIREINQRFVEEHGIRVIRRATGGGAVYHDLGNLNYSFIVDLEDAERLSKKQLIDPVVSALRNLGLNAEISGRNDILVDGKKVSGTAQRIVGNRILHHGTLLFDSDPDMIAGALNVDPNKFKGKGIQSVQSRVGSIRGALKKDMTLSVFWAFLKQELAGGEGVSSMQLAPCERMQIKKIQETKYDTWEWTYGRSPELNICNKRRWKSGLLEVQLAVGDGGVIDDIAFFGDFLGTQPLDKLLQAFHGCRYKKEDLKKLLKDFPVDEMFGGITEEEILTTILNITD